MIKAIKSMKFVSLLCITILLGGCATQANYLSMMVKSVDKAQKNSKLVNAITVTYVAGGKETNPLLSPQVGNEEFKKALEASLNAYGYLGGNKSKYQLAAYILKLDQPLVGFNMEVKSEILYYITSKNIKKQYLIKASGVATVSEALLAIERLKIANERSMQENIKEFLKRLLELK
jgi:hypothetical protein